MTKQSLKHQLEEARPRLKVVSPLAYWTILIMGFLNLFLGSMFLFFTDVIQFNAQLLVVNEVITFEVWGVVFLALGLLKLYSLASNRWDIARNSLIIGVAVKAMWMIALIIRAVIAPQTILFTILWATIALLQMGAYIWFMPPFIKEKR